MKDKEIIDAMKKSLKEKRNILLSPDIIKRIIDLYKTNKELKKEIRQLRITLKKLNNIIYKPIVIDKERFNKFIRGE